MILENAGNQQPQKGPTSINTIILNKGLGNVRYFRKVRSVQYSQPAEQTSMT